MILHGLFDVFNLTSELQKTQIHMRIRSAHTTHQANIRDARSRYCDTTLPFHGRMDTARFRSLGHTHRLASHYDL